MITEYFKDFKHRLREVKISEMYVSDDADTDCSDQYLATLLKYITHKHKSVAINVCRYLTFNAQMMGQVPKTMNRLADFIES